MTPIGSVANQTLKSAAISSYRLAEGTDALDCGFPKEQCLKRLLTNQHGVLYWLIAEQVSKINVASVFSLPDPNVAHLSTHAIIAKPPKNLNKPKNILFCLYIYLYSNFIENITWYNKLL